MSEQKISAVAAVVVVVALALSVVPAPLAHAQVRNNMAPTFQIVETSIDNIHAAYRSGALTVRQLVQAYLDRINAYDKSGPTINSIITLNPNALEEADKLDAAYKRSGFVGPLHGIPVLVKDEIDAAGMPTTRNTNERSAFALITPFSADNSPTP